MKSRTSEAIWQEKYKRWRIQVQRDGRRKSFYSSTPGVQGKAEAERKAERWIEEGDPERELTFDELKKSYLAHLRTGNGTAHKTREEATIRLYMPWGKKKVSSLSLLDYQDAIDACVEGREKPLSARTCGHVRTTIKSLYIHARKMNVKMVEPIGLIIPTGATKGKRKVLQPDDVKKLFSAEADRYYHAPLFRFIVLTGLRPGEACGLKNEDLKGSTLTIQRALNVKKEETTGKNENARRTLILPDLAIKAINDHQQNRKGKALISPWLFCNQRGKANSEKVLYHAWQGMCEGLGIEPVSVYELRHTMISLCKDDLPLPMLKAVVGHSERMDTLGTYGHRITGEDQEAADLISSVFTELLK